MINRSRIKRTRLVWKLSALVIVILALAVGLFGVLSSLILAHGTLQTARANLKINSQSIIRGISEMMMSKNNQGIRELITGLAREGDIYGNIRLVSHHSGEIIASSTARRGTKIPLEDKSCASCHTPGDPVQEDVELKDTVFRLPRGERTLSVTAPIRNEESCRSAACHAHADGPSILAFLDADYSLRGVDSQVARARTNIIALVLCVLLLGIVSFWILFRKMLERPLKRLIAGTRRIAQKDLAFQFPADRNDEIGMLEQSFNEMTARIRAHQKELLDTTEYLEGIVENSADIIITVNPEGLIQTFNRGAEQMLGYERAEVIGKPIESLFANPRERKVAIDQLQHADNVINYETHFLAKSGEVIDVLLTLSRLRDREGNPIGTFGISKDITRERRLIRELVQSKKYAAIGQTVTGIQHAIKNMLNALKGGAYLVQIGVDGDNQGRVREGLTMMKGGIDRITHLSRHMLDYAKEWKLDLERVDLEDLVRKVQELNSQGAAEKGVELLFETGGDLPEVLCDPRLIHMAVMDLLTNAIDACTEKEHHQGEKAEVLLKVFLIREENLFVIKVSDNGSGMSDEVRNQLFKPFFSTKKKIGTGLGLALTDRIIQLHGGTIAVDSELNRGSTFRIHLPVNGSTKEEEGFLG